jgi:hypothetical protein
MNLMLALTISTLAPVYSIFGAYFVDFDGSYFVDFDGAYFVDFG